MGSVTLSVDGLQEGKGVQVQVFVCAKQELARCDGLNVEKESWSSHVGGVRRLSLNTVVCVSCQERSTLARPDIPITLYVHDYTALGANLARASGVSVSPLVHPSVYPKHVFAQLLQGTYDVLGAQ
jgi:hypothetical protein